MCISDQDFGGSLHLSSGIRLGEALANTLMFGSGVGFSANLGESLKVTSKETSNERPEEQPEERAGWQVRDRPMFESQRHKLLTHAKVDSAQPSADRSPPSVTRSLCL